MEMQIPWSFAETDSPEKAMRQVEQKNFNMVFVPNDGNNLTIYTTPNNLNVVQDLINFEIINKYGNLMTVQLTGYSPEEVVKALGFDVDIKKI